MLTATDRRENFGEDCFVGFAKLASRVVAVWFTELGQLIRTISLPKANRRETKTYLQAIENIR